MHQHAAAATDAAYDDDDDRKGDGSDDKDEVQVADSELQVRGPDVQIHHVLIDIIYLKSYREAFWFVHIKNCDSNLDMNGGLSASCVRCLRRRTSQLLSRCSVVLCIL